VWMKMLCCWTRCQVTAWMKGLNLTRLVHCLDFSGVSPSSPVLSIWSTRARVGLHLMVSMLR
jgi:hypothetical protein